MSKRRDGQSARQVKLRLKDRVSRALRCSGPVYFFNALVDRFMHRVDALSPAHRERLYPPSVTLSMFMSQGLNADRSCQRVVNEWAMMRAEAGLAQQSVRTGGYCRARQRLPTTMVRELTRVTGQSLCEGASAPWRWRGRRVKLIDGTGFSMPDTAANRTQYPFRHQQAEGVGFPLGRMVVVICLATGALLDAALACADGKGNGEHGLFRRLLSGFREGDVVLGDALYSSYWIIAALQAAGVDGVFKQNGNRRTDFRRGLRLGKKDHVVEWKKPVKRPEWMTVQAYAAVEPSLRIREVRCGRRILVTTLRDDREVSGDALAALYEQRWDVELDLRSIKVELGLDVVRGQTPEMVEKEIWAGLLAYNLVRTLMAEASERIKASPRELSFKHALQVTGDCARCGVTKRRVQLLEVMYRMIGQCRVRNRKGRSEPRARKRRPKFGVWLREPRNTFDPAKTFKAEWGCP